MSDIIKLVRKDNRPFVKLVLTASDGVTPLDVSTAFSLVVYFRAAGSETILSTLTCTRPNGGADGLIQFNFPDNTLDVPPGRYEGEVEVTWAAGDVQTVYQLLKFQLREDFD